MEKGDTPSEVGHTLRGRHSQKRDTHLEKGDLTEEGHTLREGRPHRGGTHP
jgi:hypothetical protein